MTKGLKNAPFRVINFKNVRGGVFRPPSTPEPPCCILIRRKLHKKTGKKALKMHLFWVINSTIFRREGGIFRSPCPCVDSQ